MSRRPMGCSSGEGCCSSADGNAVIGASDAESSDAM